MFSYALREGDEPRNEAEKTGRTPCVLIVAAQIANELIGLPGGIQQSPTIRTKQHRMLLGSCTGGHV